jgi:hypothetical protein
MCNQISPNHIFSRQESQSRGSDETLSSPRSPEGNFISSFLLSVKLNKSKEKKYSEGSAAEKKLYIYSVNFQCLKQTVCAVVWSEPNIS